MKFVDYAKVHVQSGKGGNGCCSFRREKFIAFGGPDGGNGGKGGDIYVRGDVNKNTLLDFKMQQHFHAHSGEGGMGKGKHGHSGKDAVLEVPMGTVIKDFETDEVLMDVTDGQPRLLLEGGRGGRGNAAYKSSTNRVPMEKDEGEPGKEMWVVLELKVMADVGLVGFPNAGKSTLISRISKAHPKIADYPFTTLVPNLGVVHDEGYRTFVVADIPGIIKGAHEGTGLGLRFLKHIERTALLLLMIDITGLEHDPWEEYTTLLDEMNQFSLGLLEKPRVVALTKMDTNPETKMVNALRKKLEKRGETVFAISSLSGQGLEDLVRHLGQEVRRHRKGQVAQADGADLAGDESA